VRAIHDRIGGREHGRDIASPPRGGEREDPRFGAPASHRTRVAQRHVSPAAHGAELATALAASSRSSPTISTSARHASVCRPRCSGPNCSTTHSGTSCASARRTEKEHLTDLPAHAFASAESADLLGEEREHSGRRGARRGRQRSPSRRPLPALGLFDDHETLARRTSPSSCTTRSRLGGRVPGVQVLGRSSPIRSRRRASARTIFGGSCRLRR